MIAVVAGLLVGTLNEQWGLNLQLLGTIFIHLIEMVIVPLMLPLIILAIATMESTRTLGRLAGKSIIYFEIVTTVVILIGLTIGNLTGIGKGVDLPTSDTSNLENLQQGVDFKTMILQVFPSNVIEAMSTGNLLALLVFGAFFGVALAAIGEKAAPVKSFLDSLSATMFTVMGYIIKLTPIGVFGLMAHSAAKYGFSSLLALGQFLVILYLGFAVIVFGLFPLIGITFGVRYWGLFRCIFPATMIAFITRSTEVALAPLLDKLDDYGVSRNTYSFTVPLGYSFNCSGASMYQVMAVLFIANAYGVPMPLTHQIATVAVLMLLTKGIAAVPSASIVTLLAASTALGLPPEGVAILLAIDFFADMPRTSVNIIGDALAAVILDRSEGSFTGPTRKWGLKFGWGTHAAATARHEKTRAEEATAKARAEENTAKVATNASLDTAAIASSKGHGPGRLAGAQASGAES
ncbi:dicarboxylate/amino acid:cation symporter [Rhodococcus sp. 27YEA15]|uniref:dicarboxylate/amino acid:cation symporter n=1 Tax=Rhodococcus sp. 27YEA15 TaxID=3156259 RepID=UPI003C7B79C6